MRTIEKVVKSARAKDSPVDPKTGKRSRVDVGKAIVEIYDNLAEAIKDLGEPAVVALVNSQKTTNAVNIIRSEVVGGMSDKALQALAFERFIALISSGYEAAAAGRALSEAEQKVASVRSDPSKQAGVLEEFISEIRLEKGIVDDE